MKSIVLALITALAVRPSLAAPGIIPGPAPPPEGEAVSGLVVRTGGTGDNFTKGAYQPLDWTTAVQHPLGSVVAPLDCLGRSTYLEEVRFPTPAMPFFRIDRCAEACAEQRQRVLSRSLSGGHDKEVLIQDRMCRFWSMELYSLQRDDPRTLAQACHLYTESWGPNYVVPVHVHEETQEFPVGGCWTASYEPEPSSGTCSPDDPSQPRQASEPLHRSLRRASFSAPREGESAK